MKQIIIKIPIVGGILKIFKRYFVATKRLYNIKKCIKNNNVLRVVIGASNVYEEGWCPTNIENLNLLDKKSFDRLLEERKVDAFLAEHVWEHLDIEEGKIAANNCFSYLKNRAYIRIAVPDGLHRDREYIEAVKVDGTGCGSSDHKVLYNYKSLSKIFESVGFRVELLEYFDENGNFHYNDWSINQGMIHRSKRYDERNSEVPLTYTSIIIDAFKD